MSETEKKQRGSADPEEGWLAMRCYPVGGFIKSKKDGRIYPAKIYPKSTVDEILLENVIQTD